ncbi:unnamed protein product, partial [Rotaria magnacalcarata]
MISRKQRRVMQSATLLLEDILLNAAWIPQS